MTREEFENFMEGEFNDIMVMAHEKGQEYSRGGAFSNFENATPLIPCETAEKALWGYVVKHIEALKTFINDLEEGSAVVPLKQWNEKTGDVIVYMMLLRGMAATRVKEGL